MKTIQECKDEVARKIWGVSSWNDLNYDFQGKAVDEAAELYAQQFKDEIEILKVDLYKKEKAATLAIASAERRGEEIKILLEEKAKLIEGIEKYVHHWTLYFNSPKVGQPPSIQDLRDLTSPQ